MPPVDNANYAWILHMLSKLDVNHGVAGFLLSNGALNIGDAVGKLLPQYLMLYFSRSEFNRYSRFNSWDSAIETFSFEDMCDVGITIPYISVQKAIADIFTVYNTHKKINERLKVQIKKLCPILVKEGCGGR